MDFNKSPQHFVVCSDKLAEKISEEIPMIRIGYVPVRRRDVSFDRPMEGSFRASFTLKSVSRLPKSGDLEQYRATWRGGRKVEPIFITFCTRLDLPEAMQILNRITDFTFLRSLERSQVQLFLSTERNGKGGFHYLRGSEEQVLWRKAF